MYIGTPQEKIVKVGENNLNVATVGKGGALLLIHGGDKRENWKVWEPLLSLSGSQTMIMPDLVGYGRSSRPTETPDWVEQSNAIRGLLSEMGVKEVSLVGKSWGGQVALEFAMRWPTLVKSLVLISSTYDKGQLLRLKSLNRPTLVIWAEDDMVTQLKAGYILRDAIFTSRLIVLDPVARDPRHDFTIAHKLERFRSEQLLTQIRKFLSDPEGSIHEPPELEPELKGLAMKKKDDEEGKNGNPP